MWLLLCGWGIRGYERLRNTISSNYNNMRNECDIAYRKVQDKINYLDCTFMQAVKLESESKFAHAVWYQVTYWFQFSYTAGALQCFPSFRYLNVSYRLWLSKYTNLAVSICRQCPEDSEHHTYIKTCTTKAIAATLSVSSQFLHQGCMALMVQNWLLNGLTTAWRSGRATSAH